MTELEERAQSAFGEGRLAQAPAPSSLEEQARKDAEALRRRMEIARRYSFIHRPRS